MKKVTELKWNEVIHCPTHEIFDKIIALNPENTCKSEWWEAHEKETCYRPKAWAGTGVVYHKQECLDKGYTVYPHTDFLKPNEIRKQDLQDGDECTTRNGILWTYFKHSDRFCREEGYALYEDDLKGFSKNLDIVKVRRSKWDNPLDPDKKTIWEETKEVELTLQQIADKFEIDVDSLKIKK